MFTEFKEYWLSSGVGTILAVMLPDQSKYQIVWATTSIPSVVGSKETMDYSTTSNKAISKVEGKATTENVEVNIAWNRDTINIANKIKGQTLQYAIINTNNWTGWEFEAKASYRMGEVAVDGVLEMILQLVVSSVKEEATTGFYDYYQDTVYVENVPEVVNLTLATGQSATQTPKTFKIVAEPSVATITVKASDSAIATATYTTGVLSITPVKVGSTTISVEAKSTDMATSNREILVIVE